MMLETVVFLGADGEFYFHGNQKEDEQSAADQPALSFVLAGVSGGLGVVSVRVAI